MLEKTFEPAAVEQKHYSEDEAAGRFAADPARNAVPHTIMMPPPNVTGSLHMGHALNMTLQDVMTRYRRMQGRDALWQPGTDHAGIATQMVVERQLGAEGKSRHDLGRDKFIERVWEWKQESGSTITSQLRRLGASADWPRERFTMDEGLSVAVRKVFVQLYKEGLIYKDKRLVNWDPKLHTAISDLEVESKEVDGNLWHFKYPVEGEEGRFLIVATTRPETMLGDTAVAVNPEDERYQSLIGKQVRLPLVGRLIPIVGDDYADPETGTGAVKITPAHDFNDFEVGRRHDLEMINLFDQDARLTDEAPEPYRGLDRYEARKQVVADLDALGLLEKIEPHKHTVPHGDRSGVVIEPWLTDQWYCDAATLAKPAIKAVEDGKTEFVPKNWENTYFDWMRNIQPWCISRQLWWGHQIPAWYAEDGTVFVEETEEAAKAAAEQHFGKPTDISRDPDVLDTWFSSALWPFSTIGWPEKTPELEKYYPGDVLVTGFDIIFFWVARMMMMGLHFMGDVPFKKVYIHALVRDEKGQKMSKSKGNVIDPLQLIDSYGADGLRFTLTSMAAPGRDIKLSEQRVQGYRNFATKLWNATRFCLMNECKQAESFDPNALQLPVNRWIVGSVVETGEKITKALDNFRFDDAAAAIYQFLWGTFCDWYLEFTKPVLQDGTDAEKAEVRATAAYVLDRALHLLHPMMPFLTEELFEQIRLDDKARLIVSHWPEFTGLDTDKQAMAEIEWAIELISAIRSARSDLNVPPGAWLEGLAIGASADEQGKLERQNTLICRLARLKSVTVTDGPVPDGAAQAVAGGLTIAMPLADVIDLSAERDRLNKELTKVRGEIDKITRKLGNEQFMAKAPEAVVAEQRSRLDDAQANAEKIEQALARL
ncbi:MAG: valine--tRNA ligase [Alphaproteobacteria bacterium]|nr:valine--tRNA ligase [Alphaproteobacteria bacterium]MAX95882.1 valine--tRNA ligase [Alphaproteobacteria bacterium]MBN52899.1 valine--tRNA ligase [Alphaproteobacteria bacterium]|tara:strand:+ start:12153 stop:14795 length:2643 start_codon:yes stop_codon:yes gene_type:complete